MNDKLHQLSKKADSEGEAVWITWPWRCRYYSRSKRG